MGDLLYQFQQFKKNIKNKCIKCMLDCMLRTLESLIAYFNVYAFTQVAIYGMSYCDAAQSSWQLLRRRGMDAVVNDHMINGVLLFAALIGGCFVGSIGALFAKYVFEVPDYGYWASVGFVVGSAMTAIVMEVVSSGVCALFVCFAEDPAALRNSKPESYNEFDRRLLDIVMVTQYPASISKTTKN